jgi:hypothetical protein
MTDLADVNHWYGGDLLLSDTGDLARVARADRSRQRVVRRLMTAHHDYLSHPDYGAGLPGEIGANTDLPRVSALLRGQMLLEESVAGAPEPVVRLSEIADGVRADISYVVAPEQIPTLLSFDASI